MEEHCDRPANLKLCMDITITQAQGDDWQIASGLLLDVVRWLQSKNEPLWTEKQVSVEGLQASYQLDDMFLAYHQKIPIGVMFVQTHDPFFWPEVDANSSLFIHKLAVSRNYKGQQVAAQMLKYIIHHGKQLGRQWLRLDCDGGRPKLKAFYKSQGFTFVDQKLIGQFDTARYEMPLV